MNRGNIIDIKKIDSNKMNEFINDVNLMISAINESDDTTKLMVHLDEEFLSIKKSGYDGESLVDVSIVCGESEIYATRGAEVLQNLVLLLMIEKIGTDMFYDFPTLPSRPYGTYFSMDMPTEWVVAMELIRDMFGYEYDVLPCIRFSSNYDTRLAEHIKLVPSEIYKNLYLYEWQETIDLTKIDIPRSKMAILLAKNHQYFDLFDISFASEGYSIRSPYFSFGDRQYLKEIEVEYKDFRCMKTGKHYINKETPAGWLMCDVEMEVYDENVNMNIQHSYSEMIRNYFCSKYGPLQLGIDDIKRTLCENDIVSALERTMRECGIGNLERHVGLALLGGASNIAFDIEIRESELRINHLSQYNKWQMQHNSCATPIRNVLRMLHFFAFGCNYKEKGFEMPSRALHFITTYKFSEIENGNYVLDFYKVKNVEVHFPSLADKHSDFLRIVFSKQKYAEEFKRYMRGNLEN